MGISGLLPFVKKASKKSHVRHLSGQTAAIDAYGWLYKGAFGCAEKLGKGEPTTVYVNYCMKYVNVLLSHGVKPVLVFDGRNLPAKAVTDDKRRLHRQENLAKAKEALRKGKPAWEYFTRCLHVTPKMARELIKVLRENKIDYIIAPYEADAQMAYLARKKIVDVVITEDSDLVLFGCPKIFFKMSIQGDGVIFDQSRIHLTMDVTADKFQFDRFRQMCILSGCDYLPSLPGIGLGRAKKIFQMSINPDVKKTLKQIPTILKLDMTIPDDYLEQFIHADNTFKYQLVFDPTTRSVVPLTPYPPGISSDQLQYAGKLEKKTIALDYALGNVDIHTQERVDNFEPQDSKSGYTKTSIWVKGFEISKRVEPSTELKTNTKHTSTSGLKLSISASSIMKNGVTRETRRSASGRSGKEDCPIISANVEEEDKDLYTMYRNEKEKDNNSQDKKRSQEEEDDEVISQSSNRSKRICLSQVYQVNVDDIGSDGESKPTDSTEESNEDSASPDDTTHTAATETPMTLRQKSRNPFLKSPATIKKMLGRIEPPRVSSKTASPAKASISVEPSLPIPVCLIEKNKIYDVKSRYFRISTPSGFSY